MPEKRNKILITDDAVEMTKILEALFEANGYEVETAADGMIALEKIKKGYAPDLIILDMDMPRMGGISFYHEIASRHDGTPRFPVMVFTGRANMESVFKDLKVEGFMSKPFEMEALQKKVDSIFEKLYGSPEPPKPAEVRRAPVSRKVMIVDEDREAFDAMVIAFSHGGYEVVSGLGNAGRITEGSERSIHVSLKNEQPAVILFKVPSMNPFHREFRLAAAVLEKAREQGIPFILYGGPHFTAYEELHDEIVRNAGVAAVVSQPDAGTLLNKVNAVVTGRA